MTSTWTYTRLNNLVGWAVFLIAFVVYLITAAPTASFWDCGEFIACANELEVTHPPGAPMFLLLGRIMAMLAGSPQKVAFMVNLLSVLSGAFTALFVCWSTTMLAAKALKESAFTEKERSVSSLFAGAIAGLTCAFCDSIWFNSVEAEVYAMSGLCTALVVWLMLKWDERADEPDHLRWIVLIAYVVGLSTGVHLLNLLTIPALAMVYYFRKYSFSWKGALAAFGIGVGILGAIQYGILQYTFVLAWKLEKLFTGAVTRDGSDAGGLGMPIGTGLMVELLAIAVLLAVGLVITYRKRQVVAHVALLAVGMIMIGFSSYTVIIVRSGVTPPLDMNNPENVLTFLSYMRREQYGDRPLFRGVRYNAQPLADERGYPQLEDLGMQYILLKGEKKYVEDAQKQDYAYDDADKVFFPRMYDVGKYNVGTYGYSNYVRLHGRDEETPYDDQPTYGEDFHFFLDYQLNHMYWRYFMWNFVGRASDIQDAGWEGTGWTVKNRHPDQLNNKGSNHFFYLPFFWGIMGLIWHFTLRRRDAAFVGLLFFFTGIAIIIYLNQTPIQPRERDYSYVGSFLTFAIWVGMGMIFLAEMLRKYLGHSAAWAAGAISLIIPGVMVVQGWDDHSRAGRWVDVEFAKNMLDSCAPNSILFTGGDNDTFPLWYVQEVEGYRTDVRIVNMELLHSDWYIDQMRLPQNGTAGIPLTMDSRSYAGEANIAFQEVKPHTVSLPVDKSALLAAGVLSEREAQLADSAVQWKPRIRGYLLRRDSVAINLLQNIAKDGWKRPVYFANMLGTENYLGLEDYMRVEGLAYRFIPVKRDSLLTINDPYSGTCAPDLMMKRMMQQFRYSGLNDPSVNLDEHIRGSIVNNYRSMFFRLAAAMQSEREKLTAPQDAAKSAEWQQKIRACLTFSMQKMPYNVVRPRLGNVVMSAQLADHAGLDDLAEKEFLYLTKAALAELEWEKARSSDINLQSNIPVQSLLLRVQYLKEKQRMPEAADLAARIDGILGGSKVQEMLRQLP